MVMTHEKTSQWVRAVIIACFVVFLGGCASSSSPPKLGRIYNDAAQHYSPERNPVIFIPGILGTELSAANGTTIWGPFERTAADPSNPQGATRMAIPMGQGVPLSDLNDSVRAGSVVERLEVAPFGLPLDLQIYFPILRTLGIGGYRDQTLGWMGEVDYGSRHFTCFQFGYDWRWEISQNAERLHRFIRQRRQFVRREMKERFGKDPGEIEFDIVAHSMGGLLARYYLRYGGSPLPPDGSAPELTWEGADELGRVILINPPNAGSLKALEALVEGKQIGPFFPYYPPALVATMPSIYELLPRQRHKRVLVGRHRGHKETAVDLFNPKVWKRFGWGLADPGQAEMLRTLMPETAGANERRRTAQDHLRKCLARARQFTEAMDRPGTMPESVKLYLFAGDTESTPANYEINPQTGALATIKTGPGDGRVLRSSALMDERLSPRASPRLKSPIRWERVQFMPSSHLELTQEPSFANNLLYILLLDPRRS